MADVSHVGGLIAGGALANPLDAGFDIVTTTTHKSLRGPRGGMILCKSKLAQKVDQAVFPGMQGGPHMNAVAGIAVTLKLAAQPAFRVYAQQVLLNARAWAKELQQRGCTLITGGTENHLMVVDTIKSFGIDGRVAEKALDDAGLTVNKQVIPDDPHPPLRPSGIRLGTPALTTRGMKEPEMSHVAQWMVEALQSHSSTAKLEELRAAVRTLCRRFPVPGL
jgi:glycine hydroxymethyltransferase